MRRIEAHLNFTYSKLSIILTVACLFTAPQLGYATNKCEDLLASDSIRDTQQERSYGSLKKDFVLDPTYNVQIEDQSDIKNQCNLQTCHLHSWVSQLERDFTSTTHENLKISTHYLSAQHWLRRSLEMLDPNSDDQVNAQLGANVFASRRSILNSGIIPDEAWTGSRHFQSAPLSSRINEYIQNIVARAKLAISKQVDSKKAAEIRDQAKSEILDLFETLVGEMPVNFSYKGKAYTPKSFQRAFFPELNKPITQVLVSAERKAKTNLERSGSIFKVFSANIDIVESTMRKLLDSGQNVYISYNHNNQFVDANTGIMSISAFDIPSGAGPLPRSQRAYFKMSSSGHAAQIVGYDFDPKTNRVIKWKLKNSWGDTKGDHGYYHMFNDYFRAFVTSISFYSNPALDPMIDSKTPVQLDLNF